MEVKVQGHTNKKETVKVKLPWIFQVLRSFRLSYFYGFSTTAQKTDSFWEELFRQSLPFQTIHDDVSRQALESNYKLDMCVSMESTSISSHMLTFCFTPKIDFVERVRGGENR